MGSNKQAAAESDALGGAMASRIALVSVVLLLVVPLVPAGPAIRSGFFTTSDGVRVHYLESGTGPAMVFVPGWTMPAEIWEPQIRHFAQHYRVVALDPRSQGESAQATEGHYPERRAQDIKELVDRLRLAPAVFVGWSMAVPELLTYVEQYGNSTLRALVLVDGYIGEDPIARAAAREWAFLREIQLNRRQATEEFVRGMYRKPQPQAYLQKIIAASLKTPTNTAVTLSANVMARGDWRPVLAKLDRPVLYVVAAPQLQAQARALKAKLPSARVEFFEDAGHALFVDDAERFNAVLDDFLKTATPRAK